MKKKVLAKAPLVQALIDLRFSEIPSLASMQTPLLTQIHEAMMKHSFSEKLEAKGHRISFKFDQHTQTASKEVVDFNRYLFRMSGETSILEISKEAIIYKSTAYQQFELFYETFKALLIELCSVIPSLEKSLLKKVGLRYVDVLVPESDDKLDDYVNNDVLARGLTAPASSHKIRHLHGVTTKLLQVMDNQVLRISFEELPIESNKVTKILPDDLIEPEPKCGLLIYGQDSWSNTNSPTYGILDIDHTYTFTGSPLFNLHEVETAIKGLYDSSKDVFWSILSQKAINAWGVKELNHELV